MRRYKATLVEQRPSDTSAGAFLREKEDKNMTNTGMYNWRVAAVNNALAKRGKETGPLTVDDLVSLGHLDQYHYLGTEACDEAIDLLGLDSNSSVLDIGSGIGGPARYMSLKSNCDITGVELQADLNEAAMELTNRVGLQDKVRFVTGDFLEKFQSRDPLLLKGFDHVISLLVILHIRDRPALLQAAYDATNPGGTFLIEDFALVGKQFYLSGRTGPDSGRLCLHRHFAGYIYC
jgi:SAM-dependent methyltransferase